ncbi:hypothetical protein Nit79A3_2509 [Nitrosomonas sp. Is79A3]|uniref:small metal-binding protein SmbP n=1 Tax=Nitrosomonas sp. (strain Is79A3) TaxID=261292 RepID=UPI000215CC7F
MRKISALLAVGFLALIFNNQISASGYGSKTESQGKISDSMTETIKHAEMAKAHGSDAKQILQHAERSLKYAKEAEKEAIAKGNTKGADHINASIKHLDHAIEHAKMGHADVASKHITDALSEMHKFTAM